MEAIHVPGYRIAEACGHGSMAVVYRAVHERMQRQVALKVLHDFAAEDADYRERFLREAKAAARLNHQNLVRAYEAGIHGDTYFFAMEFVSGQDLADRIAALGHLGEPEALSVVLEVARALSAAHDHGMVHRDVKPENILLADQGGVKLADLGLAKVQGDASITAEGYTLGTVAFFSPEQCHGSAHLDGRSDLFALGATLWTALTGDPPFGRGDVPVDTMKRILQEDPDLSALHASPATRAALSTLLAKDPDDRPQDAHAAVALLEHTLDRVRNHDGTLPPAPKPPHKGSARVRRGAARPRRRRARTRARRASSTTPWPVIAALVLGAVIALVIILTQSTQP